VAACSNCGAELSADARVCPRCTAPVSTIVAEPASESQRWRRAEKIAFGILTLVLAALVVLLVLVFGFGFLIEDSTG
jgi:predicted amidophosphoribosyltransferase